MQLKCTRAVSVEAETVGARQKKNVLRSAGMREENKNEGKHSRFQKSISKEEVLKYTYGFALIPLFSLKTTL